MPRSRLSAATLSRYLALRELRDEVRYWSWRVAGYSDALATEWAAQALDPSPRGTGVAS